MVARTALAFALSENGQMVLRQYKDERFGRYIPYIESRCACGVTAALQPCAREYRFQKDKRRITFSTPLSTMQSHRPSEKASRKQEEGTGGFYVIVTRGFRGRRVASRPACLCVLARTAMTVGPSAQPFYQKCAYRALTSL